MASANGAVDQPRISARRHQRLIQLVRHRRGKLSHAAELREARMRFLMQAQLRFSATVLCHKFPSEKARQCEHQHERLELRQLRDAFWEEIQPRDKSELGNKDREA